jgi:hypothetical protein
MTFEEWRDELMLREAMFTKKPSDDKANRKCRGTKAQNRLLRVKSTGSK